MRLIASSSIARRLASINLLACATALGLAFVILTAYDFITFRARIVASRSIQAQIIGANTETALTFDDPTAAEQTLSALRAATSIEAAGLYRPDGGLFATYVRDTAVSALVLPQTPSGALEWHSFEGLRALHVVRRVLLDGNTIGIVYIRSDLAEQIERIVGYVAIALVALLLSILAAQVVGTIAARSIAAPLTELTALATTLSVDRDYSVRAVASGHGELAVLISAFNEMLAQIQARDETLQEGHALLEARVKQRTEALKQSNDELEAFCYSVSHDLRSPLRSIDGFSLALLEDLDGRLDPESADHLGRIRAATQRMGALIDDLLNLSRISRTELTLKPVDLTALARAVLDDRRLIDPDRVVETSVADGLNAAGDPRLLRQVLENLLGNAWKFTSKRASARIDVGSIEHEGATAFYVRDNGAGFNPAYAQRLFGVFQRMHSVQEFPGTGVGLAIVDRIVRRHGGRVWAEAEEGVGATFFFTLGPRPHP